MHNFITYRAVNLTLTVAKQNTTMQAIGIGTCVIHCLDNNNVPCKIELKDVLHVPLASRSLLSTSALSAQGYQAVLPSSGAIFPPGLYLPKTVSPNDTIVFARKLGHCPVNHGHSVPENGIMVRSYKSK